jgi:tetratricopeptide (TPR) repeat protein
MNLLAESSAQFDLWIPAHTDDAKMPMALNGRCWIKALQNQDLAKALSDCNQALSLAQKGSPLYARVLNSRGLVRMRLGDYEKSIADYDVSLKSSPTDPWSLYARGVDKLREKKTAEGQTDIAAAVKLKSSIADDFARYGVIP